MGKRPGEDCEDAAHGRPRKGARATNKDTPDSELQRLEPKPYFVTIALGAQEMDFKHLNGILSYDVSTKTSSWRRQPFTIKSFYDSACLRHSAFQVEGLIYCYHPDNLDQQAVFSIHTQKWHLVPPPPEISESYPALGMTVDTSEKPYSFKLFQGSLDKKTQVYDSKSGSWSIRSSLLGSLAQDILKSVPLSASCMSSNGFLYFSRGPEMILVYSIEGDSWSILEGPPMDKEEEAGEYTLGAFEGRIFTTREVLNSEDKSYVVVWELVDQTKVSGWSMHALRVNRINGFQIMFFSVMIPMITWDSSHATAISTCFCIPGHLHMPKRTDMCYLI